MRRGIFPFSLAFSRTRRGIPQNFCLFLSHFKNETFNPCFSRSRTRQGEEFCLIPVPFQGRDDTLENLWTLHTAPSRLEAQIETDPCCRSWTGLESFLKVCHVKADWQTCILFWHRPLKSSFWDDSCGDKWNLSIWIFYLWSSKY